MKVSQIVMIVSAVVVIVGVIIGINVHNYNVTTHNAMMQQTAMKKADDVASMKKADEAAAMKVHQAPAVNAAMSH
jgi:sensor histidine kinase regulating citrate/malate metabolism